MTSDLTLHMPASFDRARRISVVIVLVFDIMLWVAGALLVAVPLVLLFLLPNLLHLLPGSAATIAAAEWAKHSSRPFGELSIGRRLLLTAEFLVVMAPNIFILFHGRRLFAGFARGQVFTEATIAHFKALGLWLIVSAVLGIFAQMFVMKLLPFLYGAMTYVIAYVMAEARRIAADNAEIV